MPDQDYIKAKEKKAKEDKKASMIVITLVLLSLVGGIVFIAITIP